MRKLTIGLMAVLSVLWAGAGWAIDWQDILQNLLEEDFAPVPQTGQVLCYDSSGTTINCAGTGQDGALQKGVDFPTPRFTDKGDGTIKDNLTGLIWLKNGNCPNGGGRTWQQALDDVASLNSSGKMNGHDCGDTSGKKRSHRTDWRLPNVRELYSLVDFAFKFPAISNATGTGQGSYDDPFTNLQNGYWSSTTWVVNPDFAWNMAPADGSVLIDGKSGGLFVFAVRGGSSHW